MDNTKKRLLFIIGTRPEAIKTIPVFLESKKCRLFETRLLVSGQHKDLMDSVLVDFGLVPDFSLSGMASSYGMGHTLGLLNQYINKAIDSYQPNLILVHGDTLTAYAGGILGFLKGIPVAHIESGLRTHDIYSPFPEEFFRLSVDRISSIHFCPTYQNYENLLKENLSKYAVVTGNTGIDALRIIIEDHKKLAFSNRPTIVVTAHRRESFGHPLNNVFLAINYLAKTYSEFDFYLPLHPNPMVHESASLLDLNLTNIIVEKPQSYKDFSVKLANSFMIITDSGGIQEEASYLGKPLLILRDKTERPEVLDSNRAVLVGTNKDKIIDTFERVINDRSLLNQMSMPSTIFGDGYASKVILEEIVKHFSGS
jgi:UDP-N-acetylglucosamine 2-epimerase